MPERAGVGSAWLRQAQLVYFGGVTGKTHLALAIAAAVVRAGARGRFFNTVDLVMGGMLPSLSKPSKLSKDTF